MSMNQSFPYHFADAGFSTTIHTLKQDKDRSINYLLHEFFLIRIFCTSNSGYDNCSVFSSKEKLIFISDFTSHDFFRQWSRVRYPALADIAIFITSNFNTPFFAFVLIIQTYNTPHLHTHRGTRNLYNVNYL